MSMPESASPEVRTSAGAIRGRWEAGLAVFRGIPFAAPPVRELRFAAPVRPVPWDGMREATEFGPPPPQSSHLASALMPSDAEDWLSVNVWTPDPGRARQPVMVWIYGGAYLMGHAGDPAYDGAALARDGGVVVVSFNHRVGAEGFASFDGAPANRGLLDQVAALEWVRDNIAGFGGDPDRVTVFGESAGAGSVAALLVMPSAKGLVRRAIAQSVPGTFFSPELAADIAAAHVAELGLATDTDAAALRDVPPDALTAATEAVMTAMPKLEDRWGPVARTPTPFSPVVDGDVLPCTPWAGLAAGAAREVSLIAGHNRDEHRLFMMLSGRLGRVTPEEAASALEMFAPDPAAYRTGFPEADDGALCEQVQSDWLFRMPSLRLAEAQAAGGGIAYAYELGWPSPLVGGACHSLDIPLTLGNLAGEIASMLIGDPVPDEAVELAARFRTAWTTMAATGDPGWPPYDAVRRMTRVFDVPVTDVPYPEETSRRLWERHDFGPLPLLGGVREGGPASLR